jgi:hypothetical protein
MYLVKFFGGIKHRSLQTFETKPPPNLLIGDFLYSLINSQTVSDNGYKETFNYGNVSFSKLES